MESVATVVTTQQLQSAVAEQDVQRIEAMLKLAEDLNAAIAQAVVDAVGAAQQEGLLEAHIQQELESYVDAARSTEMGQDYVPPPSHGKHRNNDLQEARSFARLEKVAPTAPPPTYREQQGNPSLARFGVQLEQELGEVIEDDNEIGAFDEHGAGVHLDAEGQQPTHSTVAHGVVQPEQHGDGVNASDATPTPLLTVVHTSDATVAPSTTTPPTQRADSTADKIACTSERGGMQKVKNSEVLQEDIAGFDHPESVGTGISKDAGAGSSERGTSLTVVNTGDATELPSATAPAKDAKCGRVGAGCLESEGTRKR